MSNNYKFYMIEYVQSRLNYLIKITSNSKRANIEYLKILAPLFAHKFQ